MGTVPLRDAVRVWIRVALQSFGGPAGQIAVMHRILVEEKKWIGERRFLHALNYCMLLPGPEAQQLATYIGWLLHGTAGGLIAGVLFVLPGFLSILLLSVLYAGYRQAFVVEALFFGLKAAVLAIVVEAVLRIGRRVLTSGAMVVLAILAFIAIFFFRVSFPLIIAGAALAGLLGRFRRPAAPGGATGVSATGSDPWTVSDAAAPAHMPPSWRRALRVLAIMLPLWLLPIAAILIVVPGGAAGVYARVAILFSKAAVVTFGGAYAVLPYIAQQAVENFGWLQPGEMLDGLGMAETTPGPLIQVVQFVGFMAAYRDPGGLAPMLAGTLGALLTTWVTFVPCFLWIFLGAPYVESLRGHRTLDAALSAITAAIVGVVLNLAVWFSLHALFASLIELRGPLGLRLLVPQWSSLDPWVLCIALGALIAVLRFRAGMLPVLGVAALLGLVVQGLGG